MSTEKSVISYSVFGINPKYTIGMLRNLEIISSLYPGWYVYIFFDRSVPRDLIDEYQKFPRVILIDASMLNIAGMFWRFLPGEIDKSIHRMIVRDADSRPSAREVDAVNHWIKEDTSIHIMRDHPHHTSRIMGGMWGLKFSENTSLQGMLSNFSIPKELLKRNCDQDFLSQFIYPAFINDSTIHASFNQYEPHAKPFPSTLIDHRFVGEIFEHDDSRPLYERDVALLQGQKT